MAETRRNVLLGAALTAIGVSPAIVDLVEPAPGATDSATDAAAVAATPTAMRFAPSVVLELADFLTTGQTLEQFQNGSTEVAPLIQRAVDMMGRQYLIDGIPRAVHVPAGTYKQETRILPPLKGGFGIIGDGRGATRFISGTENQHMAFYGDPNAGGWDPDDPAMTYLSECYFAEYTFDASAHTVETWGSGNKKMFAIGHIKDSTFYRVRAIRTHSTAFGTDYNENNTYQECSAIECGRGMFVAEPETRVGAGSGFGIACGTWAKEKTTLINCVATGCGANGFFFETQSRKESYRKGAGFEMIGCWSVGNTFGVTDAGGAGAIMIGNYILENTLDGFRVAGTQTGFQGGVDGVFAHNYVARNGRAGVSIGGSADGGYLITDNVIRENRFGVRVEPGCTVGRGLRVRGNTIVRNASSGILFETALPIPGLEFSDNLVTENGIDPSSAYLDGITVLSPMIKPIIRNNRITANAGRPIAFRGTATTTISPRISGNDWDVSPGGKAYYGHVIADRSKISGNEENTVTEVRNWIPTPHPIAAGSRWTGTSGTVSWVSTGGRRRNDGVMRVAASNGGPRLASPAIAVSGGQIWQGSIWAKAPIGTGLRPEVWHGSVVVSGPAIKSTGEWQQLTYIAVVPAGVTALRIGAGGRNFPVGQIMFADDAMLTPGGDLWPYIDGSLPNCRWVGTAYASESIFTIPT